MSDYGFQPHAATAGGQQPTIRIRNQHTHTLKDGWRLSESTAELTLPLRSLEDAEGAQNLLEAIQRAAFEAGQEEAVRRNQEGHMEPVQ